MSEATQNNDSIYIYLNLTENEKTLHIKSNQPYQESSKYFKTKSEHICSIRKLYEYLGSEEAKEAGIDRNKIIGDFTKCQSGIELNDKATFKVELEIDVWLKNKLLWGNITFMQKVVMTFHIENDVEMIYFKDNIFQDNFTCTINNDKHKIQEHIKFEKNTFNKDLKYSSNEITSFEECSFQEINFNNHTFHNSIYFTNTTFNELADFSQCKFEKTASFYGATFKKAPNFLQAQFKGSLNLVNTNLDFDFKETKQTIMAQQEKNNNTHTTKKQNSLDSIANDFRDSFRLFKSALIKDNNLLDASKFHRIELYCKEIELDSKKPKIFSKEWIDNIVLKFYRLTSDHHTDLPKIIGWVITLIGICGLLLFVSRYGLDIEKFSQYHKDNGLVSLFQQLPCAILERTKTIIHLLYFLIFCSVFFTPFRILIYGFIALCMTCVAPKYILGVGGFIGGAIYSKGVLENLLLVTYSLLLFLLVFSLQKTARKNSIVPS